LDEHARVAITGIGCISAYGIGHAALIDALGNRRSAVRPITAFDTSRCRSHRAATLEDFDPTAFIPPLKLRRVDAVGRLALVCMRLLVEDASLAFDGRGRDDLGMALGTMTAGMDSTAEYLENLTAHGPTGAPAVLFSNTVANAAASLCAIEYGLRGPNVTFNQREASSLAAVAFAAGLIRDRRVTAMISGGADRLEPHFFEIQDRFGPFSRDDVSRPFDLQRNGFVLGEGAVILLLENLEAAAARDARVYGELLGIGAASSRAELNRWPADSSGTVRAMQMAIDDAALSPKDVDAVFASANGARALDALEAAAIRTVFGPQRVPVASLKGAIGESGAAGAMTLAAALLSMADTAVPATVGFAAPDPDCDVDVSADARAAAGRTFLVNTVGSGGTNYALVVRAAGG